MLMSSGGTKSVLHFDDLENLFCIIDGSKTVILIDPFEGRQALDFDPIGLNSLVDVDK